MGKIGKSMGKALLKTLKTFGIRPDDVIELLEDMEIDNFIISELDNVKEKFNENEIVIIGHKAGDKFLFRAMSVINEKVTTEEGTKEMMILNKYYPIELFNKTTDSFNLIDLLKRLINMIFNNIQKSKKK